MWWIVKSIYIFNYKLKIVSICGASFGRSEENTFAFTDHSKISSKHC